MQIVVAMSGGVDSSVAAYMLKKQGHNVVGLFMSSGIEIQCANRKLCCSAEDARDAKRTADIIGIPFYSINFQQDFEGLIRYFCDEYNIGRTPNPCIVCNQKLKFGKLLEYANSIGADAIATGHYASAVKTDSGRFSIKRAKDPLKDQSYVLFSLSQEQLSKTILPLGGLSKAEVRRIAGEANLPVKDKPESQDVCFVPDNDYRTLLNRRTPELIKRGEVRDTAGKLLGYHNGFQFYTIGQRQGLGIALGKPAYVVRIDAATNTVVLGDDEELFKKSLAANRMNWSAIPGLKPAESIDVLAQIRYHHTAARAKVSYSGPDSVMVEFEKPQRAVTPGQAVVFYNDDGIIMGGGWIDV